MKKIIKVLLFVVLGIIALALVLPFFFKDQIKEAVDKEIDKTLDAQVVFDIDNFGLTLFKDFPNMTLQIEEFGVINNAPFEGDTLAMIGEFGVTLDIMSVFSGEQMKIKKVYIDEPVIKIQVSEDGKANYDIAKGESEEDTTTSESHPFGLKLDHWEITKARIVYDDRPTDTRIELIDFYHYGNGEISDVFDLNLQTAVNEINVNLEGTQYYTKSKFDSDITLHLDLPNGKYEFKENEIAFNQFAFGFDGSVIMPSDDINLDITFGAKKTSFKNILSIVPGMFMEDFDNIKTAGKLGFDGFVKGVYNETTMPGFALNLNIDDAMFQYPDLPTAVKNIVLHLKVDNADANMDNIGVEVEKFHMDLGSNPIDFNMVMNVLESEDFDIKNSNLAAKVNLAEISSFYPVDGIQLKGIFGMNAKIQGLYSEKKESMPTVSSHLTLDDGWVRAEEYNVTAEDMTCNAWVKYNDKLTATDTVMKVDHFGLTLDGERFGSELAVWNLDDISWDFSMNGRLDLEKLMKLSPIEGTTIKGIVNVDHIRSIGKLSDVEAENYNALETHGKATITDFEYFEEELLPQGFKITKSELEVDPNAVYLKTFDGFIGKSDMKMKGKLSNYMGYTDDLMKDTITPHGTLKGELDYYTSTFYTDEWLDTTEVVEAETLSEAGDVTDYAIPKNIHFVMQAEIDKILYDNMEIKAAEGELIIRDGIVDMSGLKMNILGGNFNIDGQFNTFNPLEPTFDFAMDIDKLSFKQSYETFNTVKKMAPIAKNIDGFFSTKMKFNGPLDGELMPVYEKLNGAADFFVKNAKMKDLKIVEKITEATKMYKTDQLKIENTLIETEVIDGKTHIKEFPATTGETNFKIKGNRSLDGIIDFDVLVDMPAGKAQSLNSTLQQYGINDLVGDRLEIPLKITGEETNPKVAVLGMKQSGGSGKATPKAIAGNIVQSEAVQKEKEAQKKKILDDAKKQADKIKAEGKIQGKKAKDEYYWQAKDLEKKATKPWEKAGAKVAADKMRKEGDAKEKQIINEANKKADDIMKKAQQEANKI